MIILIFLGKQNNLLFSSYYCSAYSDPYIKIISNTELKHDFYLES